ncbi:hypothetical protein HYH03_014412 [Edaphochlamys debaryana]|uniref:Uncharacterized protein n=1 Tax=Edaphochlamys debaryana TaxID=47281 RepID=A0A836BTI6_9CHLO|nr:hypothetical protein HYH03_014412 [Edaphochlamys debaryana]|eukprot:KAG2486913.1 hypothetical protein HYH03_014412 [Edaphochlamys debaryana]
MQEWVADVGARAGLTHTNTRLSSGSVGVAESRLELEVTFPSMSEWEHFLTSIPAKEHRAWSQRVQGMIVGGSPRWELYRSVPAFPDGPPEALAAATRAAPQRATAQAAEAVDPLVSSLNAAMAAASAASASGAWNSGGGSSSSGSGASVGRGAGAGGADGGSGGEPGKLSFIDNASDAEVVLDWKGDPLKINPGDKLPFKFL